MLTCFDVFLLFALLQVVNPLLHRAGSLHAFQILAFVESKELLSIDHELASEGGVDSSRWKETKEEGKEGKGEM
jgi:hypothetical protein